MWMSRRLPRCRAAKSTNRASRRWFDATWAKRLQFTIDAARAVEHGLFLLLAVGTPPGEDGSADLSHVVKVAQTIGQHLSSYAVVMTKSTVHVGPAYRVREEVASELARRGAEVDFDVVSNPEFLKEGAAVADFMKPDRVVVGTDNPRTMELLRALYEPFTRNRDRFVVMDVRSAELTKYAANAMLATKISFMNEMANIAERVGADIEKVRLGIGSDPRIGYQFLYPGTGYGGSCFPDVRAGAIFHGRRIQRAPARGGGAGQLRPEGPAVPQDQWAFRRQARRPRIALWGLAFKPNTDDLREAPSLVLIDSLLAAGARVQAFDPVAMPGARKLLAGREGVTFAADAQAATEGADVLAIVTEWQEFRSPDFDHMKQALKQPAVFDGRNLYSPELMRRLGLSYYAVGRGLAGATG
jgi:UDPglucose 6-dehydrogenase